jgi:phage gp36-like protein
VADYAVQADLERAAGGAANLVQLADLDADGSIDAVGLAAVINDASRWVDSYLARRYDVPLASPSDIIRRVTAEEAVYQLKKQRRAVDADARTEHEDNERWLEGVRDGAINPGVDPPPAKSTAVAATTGVRDSDDPDQVTRNSLKGFW